MKTKITAAGQAIIPEELRREMDLNPGQTLVWHKVSPTECRVEVERNRKVKGDPVAALGFAKAHGLETMPTDEWMKFLREGEDD